jgi:hypothetical protein
MGKKNRKTLIVILFAKSILIFLILFGVPHKSFCQNQDSLKKNIVVNGSVSITNNGFGYIPSFALNKPAAIAKVTIDERNLSFYGEFRYALEGRPWALAIISRYKLVNTTKEQISVGFQFPSIIFRKTKVVLNGSPKSLLSAKPGIAPEFRANFQLSSQFSIGADYTYFRWLDNTAPQNGHLMFLRSRIANMKVSSNLKFSVEPQIFYLKVDKTEGFYPLLNIVLSKDRFPITISSMMYRAIDSNIGGKYSNWNISLNYLFRSSYLKK